MTELQTFIDDLRAEGESLDALVADLPEEKWATMTPAEGWTIAHQIGHLHWTDSAAILAITDPDGFAEQLKAAFVNPAGFVDDGAAEQAARQPAELLADWRAGRTALVEALTAAPAGTKFPWYGPPMGGVSMATARLMETWAHGQDVADALGVERAPTARIKNIAHLGVRTRNFAYSVNEKTPPADDFRVELTAPDGSLWTWGAGRCAAEGHRAGVGLLLAGHPACQSRRSRSGRRGCRRGRVARVRAGLCRTQR